jgi:hypothetical protein
MSQGFGRLCEAQQAISGRQFAHARMLQGIRTSAEFLTLRRFSKQLLSRIGRPYTLMPSGRCSGCNGFFSQVTEFLENFSRGADCFRERACSNCAPIVLE